MSVTMTSEVEALKTNEFLRRRKLRIQQVREQSKDIAKRIRQRASAEKFRQVAVLDSEKGRAYLEQQDKLVKKLEHLYAKRLDSVGVSHKQAVEVTQQGEKPEKADLSKQRARVAAAELRRKNQEKLDERKKSLDRKLIAREIANEISRDKSSGVVNKQKSSSVKTVESVQAEQQGAESIPQQTSTTELNNEQEQPVTNEMATQWDYEALPKEWEPHIPVLSLPKDDTPKETSPKNLETKSNKNKKPNLFALSEEMPSSLRGGLTSVPEESSSVRPSLTLVSDYLQNRDLRLREPDTVPRKHTEDLQSIKRTLMRTRAARAEVSGKVTTNVEVPSNLMFTESSLSRKSSVPMYNHSTRDVRNVPFGDRKLVIRDSHNDEDAYSQAMKESTIDCNKDKENQKRIQELRNKIAVTKQNVDKEYKDTMAFLKTLPKDKSKPIKNAFKDDHQQQMQKECRQRKLQQEYKKIQKECKKHPHMSSRQAANKSKSPVRLDSDDDFNAKDFQYSWMPVPESDKNLAIHTIPTTLKENKTGNAVKFSKIDSYHEYRSRHKHTPPTKDTYHEKQKEVFIEEGSELDSYSASETSSVENARLDKSHSSKAKKHTDGGKLTDAEKIIIYKVLDSKEKAEAKQNAKVIKDIAKSLSIITKDRVPSPTGDDADESQPRSSKKGNHAEARVSFEHLKEGLYKSVNERGDNIASGCFNGSPHDPSGTKCDSSNFAATRPPKWCVDVACGADGTELKSNNVQQSSASTSTSSFKTATNNKATSFIEHELKSAEQANKPPDGIIKLVDENGQESGKFYIGATGFLKDDDYEVIIQLRKKDATKVDGKDVQNLVEKKLNKTESNPEPTPSGQGVARPQPAPAKADLNAQTHAPEIMNIAEGTKVSENQMEELFLANVNFDNNVAAQERYKPKHYVDQGAETILQDSFALSPNFAKASSNIKPGTSISTQTTLDSPVQRPVLIHMSSSTSTAYMSPPEYILPSFLKHNLKMDDISDETSDMYHLRVNRAQECRNRNTGIEFEQFPRQKKHVTAKPNVSPSHSPTLSKQSPKQMNKKLRVPPNTARSTSSGYGDHKSHNCRKRLYSANSFPLKKCNKCEKYSQMKLYLKSLAGDSSPSNKRSTRHSVRRTNSSLSHKLGNKPLKPRLAKEKLGRYELNPVVKWYVDKLLMMNRDGLKAVEVVDQQCSAVTTPGSSIIDVPQNIDRSKPILAEPKISLQQIKDTLIRNVLNEYTVRHPRAYQYEDIGDTGQRGNKMGRKCNPRIPKKKSVHKVKSLNISKNLIPSKSDNRKNSTTKNVSSASTSVSETSSRKTDDFLKFLPMLRPKPNIRSKSSPSPRRVVDEKLTRKNHSSDILNMKGSKTSLHPLKVDESKPPFRQPSPAARVSRASVEAKVGREQQPAARAPLTTSTQTSRMIDEEINYIKLAESKLQNMEKIADLTEKCTQRLSNLAKVLEEVRRNKSIAYSQVSDTASDSDRASSKNSDTQPPSSTTYEPVIEVRQKDNESPPPRDTSTSPQNKGTGKHDSRSFTFVPFLQDIPKPQPQPQRRKSKSPSSPEKLRKPSTSPTRSLKSPPADHPPVKSRKGKPPPALSRKCLKRTPEVVIPHELSTVIEVDSPLSVKLKSQSARNDTNTQCESADVFEPKETITEETQKSSTEEQNNNPDLVQSNANLSRRQPKVSSTDSDESKLQMMDLRKFNEIMLKPFISIQEYAKQCNVTSVEEPSNGENNTREEAMNDELSSLHSDGSLPDVIAELLKRKLINEPFKFESASNANSTTVSSESTLSVLALSKVKKDRKKITEDFSNKENIIETSDTLSVSSNPDLENAFKKLGMGWASSTLKKTKEHLALSSSSNTSSSSLSQFKTKSSNHEFPALVTDSISTSIVPRAIDSTKSAEQQTSMVNSMTVKQFLTKELAKKITFSKSHRDTTEEGEFISLYETKIPDEMKETSHVVREERSVDSNPRARTSTPVQLFKSMTYHSSSSSNMSNGLFSNADDLSSVKGTSNSLRNHSTSDKDDLTIPNFSLRLRKANSDCSKSD